ncbi:MAG TPA: ABC transporter substrate-binding protein [Sulfuricella sp.]|nr:ABC transporter substrate-binding protein [Sulfuricella sp.]
MLTKYLKYALALLLILTAVTNVQAEERIVVSVPGPRNISYLPIDLISKIGADKEVGVKMDLLHTGGGAVALNNMVTRNADFSVAGMPAAMSLRANGGDVVAVAAVDDAPLFVLMVRAQLKGKVKKIADLKGKVIGVNTSTKNSKTTSQQLAELLLKSGGVPLDAIRIVPAGQSWVEQSSLMITGAADAVMGDEPFASRLLADGKVFFLANLAEPETVKNIPGSNFLHAAVETRSELIRNSPQKVEKMVAMLRKTLQWMASHKPEEIVDRLGVTSPEERESLLVSLRKYPRTFTHDGKFSTSQLKETEHFFRTTSEGNPPAQALKIESMVDDRWAGRSK